MRVAVYPIELEPGVVALVDQADADLVAGFSWHRIPNGYVQAQRGRLYVYLHRLIAGAGPGETRSLGKFATEDEAALAYNRAAVETWGEFARLNVVAEGITVAGPVSP